MKITVKETQFKLMLVLPTKKEVNILMNKLILQPKSEVPFSSVVWSSAVLKKINQQGKKKTNPRKQK